MKVENIDVDQIWRDLGPFGKFTWKQISCYLAICVSWIIHQLTIVFIGYRPNYTCRAPATNISSQIENGNITHTEYGDCSIKTYYNDSDGNHVMETSCVNGWEYDIPRQQSFVTEWDFVCENAELAELTQTLLTFGMMVGTFICPTLSDKYGRKPVMVFSQIILFGITIGTAFSPNYYVFLVLRILTGTVSQGALSGTTLSLESLPTEVRSTEEVLALTLWTTGICMISPIAYALRNVSWRYAQITFALLGTWSLLQWWILDESLRWVIANGQIDRAKAIIKRACKWNNKDYDTIIRKSGLDKIHVPKKLKDDKQENGTQPAEEVSLVPEETETEVSPPKYSAFKIITNRAILKVSLIMWVLWITDSLVYYGLYMISSDLYGNRYVNFFLSGIIEFPAALFEYLAFNRLGRKWTCLVGHIVAGIGLIVATILQYSSGDNTSMLGASTAFTLIGKMAITVGFSSAFLLTPELYPTNMRNTGLGIASFMGKVGGMLAPFFRNLSQLVPWLPGAIFSLMIIITIILLAFVPETNGVDLPQTMDELSEWYKVNNFSFKVGKNEAVENKQKKKREVELILNEKQ